MVEIRKSDIKQKEVMWMISKRVQRMMAESAGYPYAKSACGNNGAEIIKLCSNESPLGPPPKVVEAIRRESERVGI